MKQEKALYAEAEIEIVSFTAEDILTTSDTLDHVDQSDSSWD